MRKVILLLPILFFACSQKSQEEHNTKQKAEPNEVARQDSVITLEIHAKKGDQFFFGYTDPLYNFNVIETPEKLKVDSVFKKKIISLKPVLLRDIHWMAQNYIYVIPGETYRITKDSLISNFEIKENPKRTYELNAFKELKKHIKKHKRLSEWDFKDQSRFQKFAQMDLKARDSVLKTEYEDNIKFFTTYTCENNFSSDQKKVLLRNLFYQYKVAHFNFFKRSPEEIRKYVTDNKILYNELLPLMRCDSCFDDPEFPYLTQVFARHFVADPQKIGVEKAYTAYNQFFKGKTRDYLLYNLIKLGGMFNATKPNPKLAKTFQQDAHDPLLKNYIKEMYDFLEIKKSATGSLADAAGKNITWGKVLEKHKGKVVYVDFWASWCGPCRAEMPASKLLKKRFEKKDVVFVNISMDENSAAWKKASKSEGIDTPENYILIQPDKSVLKKQFRITSIPRYFLVNKSGKVVNYNALRPSDSKIVSEIEGLL